MPTAFGLYVSLAAKTSDNLIEVPELPDTAQQRTLRDDLKTFQEMQDLLEREKAKINERIAKLERKIEQVMSSSPKKYPSVKRLSFHDQKRVLVSGGAGFVGSHLVDRLMIAGHQVIVADNFVTGRKRNIEHWVNHENFELIHHDIVNPLMGKRTVFRCVIFIHFMVICSRGRPDLSFSISRISAAVHAESSQDDQNEHYRHD